MNFETPEDAKETQQALLETGLFPAYLNTLSAGHRAIAQFAYRLAVIDEAERRIDDDRTNKK